MDLSPFDLRRAELHDRIRRLAASASVEVSPRDGDDLAASAEMLKPGCDVSITWMPRDTIAERVAAAVMVRRAGFEPVPHVAARFLQSRDELRDFLKALRGEADVRRILLIGGDRSTCAGPFASAFEVLRTGVIEAAGIEEGGITLYPEGHPQVADEVLIEAFASKAGYLEAAELKSFAVTQLCFDARDIVRLLLSVRRLDYTGPLRVGLAGPASFSTLVKFAARCGVGASTKAILSRTASMTKLLTEAGPDPIIRDLAESKDLDGLQPISLHFFPFGGLTKTCRFVHALAEGRFDIPVTQSGLHLT